MNTETVKATGQRTGIGYARTGTMDGYPHRTPQGMDVIAETAIMADAAAVHITDREKQYCTWQYRTYGAAMRQESDVEQTIGQYADMVKHICFVYMKNESDTETCFRMCF